MYLVSAEEMRKFDAMAIGDFGIPGVVLMENAGRTTYQILKSHLEGDHGSKSLYRCAGQAVAGLSNKRVAVVAGPGNNGGDGYVIARHWSSTQARSSRRSTSTTRSPCLRTIRCARLAAPC